MTIKVTTPNPQRRTAGISERFQPRDNGYQVGRETWDRPIATHKSGYQIDRQTHFKLKWQESLPAIAALFGFLLN
jgi:hypothetical protein